MKDCNFCKKYNMSESDFLNAIRDGKISTTVLRHDEIYTTFKNTLSGSTGTEDAVIKTSIQEGVDVRTVYRVISEFK